MFHQTEGAPVTKGLELLPGSPALNRAAREIVQAKQRLSRVRAEVRHRPVDLGRADRRAGRHRSARVDARRCGGVRVMFTDDQKSLLEAKLDPGNVKSRKGANGATVSYVEGWYVIAEANRIFGFGNGMPRRWR